MSNELTLDFNDLKTNNMGEIINKYNSSRKKRNYRNVNNSKTNLYSIRSFNAVKISWSNERKKKIKNNKMINSIKTSNKKENNVIPNKSFYYKDKKLNIHKGKFVDYKHFSPLPKNKIIKKENVMQNENY